METLNQKEVSHWLTNLPIKQHGYESRNNNYGMPSRLDITGHLIEFNL